MKNKTQRLLSWILIGMAMMLTSGCKPGFVNQLTGGGYSPLAPGDTPYVLAHVVNATEYSIHIVLGIKVAGGGSSGGWLELSPNMEGGFLLPGTTEELSVGSMTDRSEPALTFTTEEGGNISAPASAFPWSLVAGEDFETGDAVIFTIINDATSPFKVSVYTGVIEGEGQQGPFAGPDTFANFDMFLQSTGSTIEIVR